MPYKNIEDRKRWELLNKDKLTASQEKYRKNHPDKIKENNKIVHARRDEKRKKERVLLDRIKDVKPVKITKLCSRCHAEIELDSSSVSCTVCGTRFHVVSDYECRYSHGVRLKVATA